MADSRQQHIDAIADQLAAAGVASPAWDAKTLVAYALPHERDVTAKDLQVLDELVKQRVARVPLQLLTKETGFRYLTLTCRPDVFIPRPETEVLVDLVLPELAGIAQPRVIEPCTGTGAIAASLAAELAAVAVVATDINPTAVALARHNMTRVMAGDAGVPKRPQHVDVSVCDGSLFEPVPKQWRGSTDVIVCNPPYLPPTVLSALPPEVVDHDPHEALIGGPDGHEIVAQVLFAATGWLKPGGLIALEIDATRTDDACQRAAAAGLVDVSTHTDLTGARRFITARREN